MNMCPTNKCKSTPESCLKGQVFFIWTSCSSLETVKDRISLLGGKVEQFLSKDVTTVLLEDNQLGIELSPNLQLKPAYGLNGTVVATFPYSGTLSSIPSTSRGYNFITANTSTKNCTPYRIICYARQFGIQILGIGQFLTWTEPQIKYVIRQKQRKALESISILSGYFIKFESINKTYRPCYKMFNNDADHLLPIKNAKVLVKPENCIVMLNKPVGSKQLHFTHMDTATRLIHQAKGANLPVKGNEKKPLKAKPKEENNYCECCKTHFADFKQHIRSTKHQSFVSNEKNYESVHNILKMLPTAQEFIENLQNPSPSSDPALTNGDTSRMSAANIPDTDFSVPLNLQVRKQDVAETAVPVNMHVGKGILSQSLQLIKDEIMPLPLDLHVKRNDEIKAETKCDGVKTEIKQETDLLANFAPTDLLKKEEPAVLQPKIEANEDSLVNVIDEPEMNGGDFESTAALAQMCLKNFDSYWLDTLPCEVDDMVFDDIFDFDDGKTAKPDNEALGAFPENVVNSEIAQSPGLVSGISTSNLKTTENTSVLMSTPIDVKDFIKTEPPNLQSFPPTCKLDKENEAEVVSQAARPSFNESLAGDKKQIFSIVSFCSDKIGVDASPSCSTAVPAKDPEPLFSSESSDDDENGSVLISNALDFIIKRDRESSDENSQDVIEVDDLPDGKASSKSKNDKNDQKFAAVKDDSNSNHTAVPTNSKTPSLIVNQAVENKKIPTEIDHSLMDKLIEDKGSHNNDAFFRANTAVSSPPKQQIIDDESAIAKKDACKNTTCFERRPDPFIKSLPSVIQNSSMHKSSGETLADKVMPSSTKNSLENPKETASSDKPKEWDYTCNKIYKKYTPMNRTFGNTATTKEKTLCKENESEVPNPVQGKHPEERIIKSSNEKYPNPKKNISLREMAGFYNKPEVSSFATSVIERENPSACPDIAVNTLPLGKDQQTAKDYPKGLNVSDKDINPVTATPYIGHYESPYENISPVKNPEKENHSVSQIDLSVRDRSIISANQVSFANTINEDDWKEVTSIRNFQSQKESLLNAKYAANKKTNSNISRNSDLSNNRVHAPVADMITSAKNAHPQVAEVTKSGHLDFSKGSFVKGNPNLCNSSGNQVSYEADTNFHSKKGKIFKEKFPPKTQADPAHSPEAPVDLVSSQTANRAAHDKNIPEITANAYTGSVLQNPVPSEKVNKDPPTVIKSPSEENRFYANKKHNFGISAVSNSSANVHSAYEATLNPPVAPLNYAHSMEGRRGSQMKVDPKASFPDATSEKTTRSECDVANQSASSAKHALLPEAHKSTETKTSPGASSADIVSGKQCSVTNQNSMEHSNNATRISPNAISEGRSSKDIKHKNDLKVTLNTSNVSASNSTPGENRTNNRISVTNNSQKDKESTKYTIAPLSKYGTVNPTIAVPENKRIYHFNYEKFTPSKRKKTCSKERRVHKKRKQDPASLVYKHSVSETVARKGVKKQSVKNSSTNPCQYSYRTAKYNVDSSSSSVQKLTSKIPHKKESKLDLPPLWTVSVSGVKLKFTRIRPEKVDTYQYVTEDESD